MPWTLQLLTVVSLTVVLWAVTNWVYQAYRKPTLVLSPVSGALAKTPAQTWREYGGLFRRHATGIMTPELLAALAQVEGAGNPAAQTYWRWRPTANPFALYAPASSAVGMYQITDGVFQEARRYCIRDHVVVEDGPWSDPRSCWFNGLYTRLLPSHAIEMTAARLDRAVTRVLGHHRRLPVSLQQKQDLAAVIHLCGVRAGEVYAARGFRLLPQQRCGDHDVARYLARIHTMTRLFTRLASTP